MKRIWTLHTTSTLALAGLLLSVACDSELPAPATDTSGDGDSGGDGDTLGTGSTGQGGDGSGGTEAASGGVSFTSSGGSSSGGAPEVVLPNPLIDGCTGHVGGMGGMPSVGSADGALLIEDFEDGDATVWTNGISGHWESHNDFSEAGAQSPLGGRHEEGKSWIEAVGGNETFGPGRDSSRAAHFTGSGFEFWGAGQALYLAVDESGDECTYDATAFDGMSFWAKGTIELEHPDDILLQPKEYEVGKLKLHVVERDVVPNDIGGGCDQERYECWDSHRARVELKGCWQKFVIPFSELTIDGWSKDNPGELDLDQLYQLVFEVAEYQSYDIYIDDIEFFVGDTPDAVTCQD